MSPWKDLVIPRLMNGSQLWPHLRPGHSTGQTESIGSWARTPSLCGRGGRQIGATSRCGVVETMIRGSRIGSPDLARPAAALVGLACDLSQARLTPLLCRLGGVPKGRGQFLPN